jgi:hypothetical protein
MPKPNHFVMAPLEPLIAAARTLKSPALLVWLYLEYQWRLTQRQWVEVTNVEMGKWGVSRRVKYAALALLENGGIVQVERNGRQSPRVARRLRVERKARRRPRA